MTETTTLTNMQTSIETEALFTALVAAQVNMTRAVKGSVNPFFKKTYASLGDIAEACMPALNGEGIAVIQGGSPAAHNGSVTMTTRFCHTSGQWIEGSLTLPLAKSDPQGLGSAVTYGRRYLLAAMGGVIMADDDGNAATGKTQDGRKETAPAGGTDEPPKGDPASPATKPQLNMIFAKAKAKGIDKEDLVALSKATTGRDSRKDYTKGDIDKMIEAIDSWTDDGLHDDQNLPF